MQQQQSKAQTLNEWGFVYFESLLVYKNNEASINPKDLPSDEEFELIRDAMGNQALKPEQMVQFLFLADKFLLKKEVLAKFLSDFLVILSSYEVALPSEFKHTSLWETLKNHIVDSTSSIAFSEEMLVLEGLNVVKDSKQAILSTIRNLSPFFYGIHFKDLPFSCEDSNLLQEIVQPHFTSVSFERCPLVSPLQLDFSALANLTHFQFSACYNDDLMSMLETIQSKKLLSLDISANQMKLTHQERLMKFLLRQKNLRILIAVKENSTFRDMHTVMDFPKIKGEILTLRDLQHLDLSESMEVESFVSTLNEMEGTLNLEHLSIPYCKSYTFLEIFCKNFKKLTNLKYLAIPNLESTDYLECLTEAAAELKKLEIIYFHESITNESVQIIIGKNEKYNTNIVMDIAEVPELMKLSHVYYMKAAETRRMYEHCIKQEEFQSFNNTTSLTTTFFDYGEKHHKTFESFYSQFRNLKKLVVIAGMKSNITFISQLLNNNSIENLEINFELNFTSVGSMLEILQGCKVKSLSLLDTNMLFMATSYVQYLVPNLLKASLWNNLEELTLSEVSCSTFSSLLATVQFSKLNVLKVSVNSGRFNSIIFGPIPTIKKLEVYFVSQENTFGTVQMKNFLAMFPNVIDLKFAVNSRAAVDFDVGSLEKLRSLIVFPSDIENQEKFFEQLTTLPFLTHFILSQRKFKTHVKKYGHHPMFNNLIYSEIYFDSSIITKYFPHYSHAESKHDDYN